MPKSKQRKAHKVKKQKFQKSQIEAKELHTHRMNKYVSQLMEKMKDEQLAKQNSSIEEATIIETLDELKESYKTQIEDETV